MWRVRSALLLLLAAGARGLSRGGDAAFSNIYGFGAPLSPYLTSSVDRLFNMSANAPDGKRLVGRMGDYLVFQAKPVRLRASARWPRSSRRTPPPLPRAVSVAAAAAHGVAYAAADCSQQHGASIASHLICRSSAAAVTAARFVSGGGGAARVSALWRSLCSRQCSGLRCGALFFAGFVGAVCACDGDIKCFILCPHFHF